jgi:hypothetical protein
VLLRGVEQADSDATLGNGAPGSRREAAGVAGLGCGAYGGRKLVESPASERAATSPVPGDKGGEVAGAASIGSLEEAEQ